MTGSEWLACTDPTRPLGFVREKTSERKLRLFAVACCRQAWDLFFLHAKWIRKHVEVAEQFADGQVEAAALRLSHEIAMSIMELYPYQAVRGTVYMGAAYLTRAVVALTGAGELEIAAQQTAELVSRARQRGRAEGYGKRQAIHSDLLRDIVGNPFRRSLSLPRAVLAWNDATVRRIAEGIYEERAFTRLPILADALLDAGCDDEDLLAHCRSAGPHVLGCWVVDLILGKS